METGELETGDSMLVNEVVGTASGHAKDMHAYRCTANSIAVKNTCSCAPCGHSQAQTVLAPEPMHAAERPGHAVTHCLRTVLKACSC